MKKKQLDVDTNKIIINQSNECVYLMDRNERKRAFVKFKAGMFT